MTFSSLVGDRLKEARKLLDLSQAEIAEAVGVTREYWGRCERGASVPGGEVLAALAQQGADVLYILTGQRSGGAAAPAPERAVSEGDRILLDNFHAAPAQVQEGVKTALGAFAPGASAGAAKRGKAA